MVLGISGFEGLNTVRDMFPYPRLFVLSYVLKWSNTKEPRNVWQIR
jgi:hypothetical protein